MLVLHGFSSSNYYNLVKLALLEKQLPFEERLVYTGASDDYRPDYLELSPIGKVPCLETSAGMLTAGGPFHGCADAAPPRTGRGSGRSAGRPTGLAARPAGLHDRR